jgi:tellurite resistance protein TerC
MQAPRNEAPDRTEPSDSTTREIEAWTRSLAGSAPLRLARRIGIGVVGSAVLGVGVIMLVTPGPAFVVIPMGLGILALEFEWARRWLDRVKDYARHALGKDQEHKQSGA